MLDSDNYQPEILGHVLRLQMKRRPCIDPNAPECIEGRPPIADYPRYSSVITPYSDLLHLDIKIPGEHTLEGEEFDAEIQMLHTHFQPDPPRVSSLGIPIRATVDGHNAEFQDVIDRFQLQYDIDDYECETSGRRQRRRTSRRLDMNMTHVEYQDDLQRRQRELESSNFDPYSESFMRDIYFYRYDGSITEPPCFFITWWVMIDPMIISYEQLYQLKVLLFTHVDPTNNCLASSVHNEEQKVTRPIFPLGSDREIQKCEKGDFISDIEKGRGDGNKC